MFLRHRFGLNRPSVIIIIAIPTALAPPLLPLLVFFMMMLLVVMIFIIVAIIFLGPMGLLFSWAGVPVKILVTMVKSERLKLRWVKNLRETKR